MRRNGVVGSAGIAACAVARSADAGETAAHSTTSDGTNLRATNPHDRIIDPPPSLILPEERGTRELPVRRRPVESRAAHGARMRVLLTLVVLVLAAVPAWCGDPP